MIEGPPEPDRLLEALGPLYTETDLAEIGVEVDDTLIALADADRDKLYPYAQFETQEDGRLQTSK